MFNPIISKCDAVKGGTLWQKYFQEIGENRQQKMKKTIIKHF